MVYSPLARESVRNRLLQGLVGPENEICTILQRARCDKNRVCIAGPDKGAYPICRAIVVSVDFAEKNFTAETQRAQRKDKK